jgi:hypothetical protein
MFLSLLVRTQVSTITFDYSYSVRVPRERDAAAETTTIAEESCKERDASCARHGSWTDTPSRQCSTFTGMRDLRESNNLHKRIKSGIEYHLNTNTTRSHVIKPIC